jgi:hypothetical protein
MRTIQLQLYNFSELSDRAKSRAVSDYIETNYDWWDSTLADAGEVGITIDTFDIDRGNTISGSLDRHMVDVIDLILINHDRSTDTFTTAKEYKEYKERLDALNEEEGGYEDEYEDLEEEFREAILKDYLCILRREYEYQTSEEYFLALCEANDWEFYGDGRIA